MTKRRLTNRSNAKSQRTLTGCFSTILIVLVLCAGVFLVCSNQEEFTKLQYPLDYYEYVEKYSEEYDVPKSLIFAVIRSESSFDSTALSYAGAHGLMQITSETFDWLQYRRDATGDYVTSDLYIPEVNIDYGTYFLSYLLDKYESEATAIAAYNAGVGAVDGWLQDKDISNDGVTLDNIPYPETANYVKKVISAKEVYSGLCAE